MLFEAGKYIRDLGQEGERVERDLEAVKRQIDELNNQIECDTPLSLKKRTPTFELNCF